MQYSVGMRFKEGTFSGQFAAFLPGNIDIVITIHILTAVDQINDH